MPLKILFPKVRANVLRLLFGSRRRQRHVSELARKGDVALSTVQEELRKLEALGLVTSFSNGYHRFYSANSSHRLFQALSRLVILSDELTPVVHNVRAPRRKRRTKAANLRPERQPHWGIFSPRSR